MKGRRERRSGFELENRLGWGGVNKYSGSNIPFLCVLYYFLIQHVLPTIVRYRFPIEKSKNTT